MLVHEKAVESVWSWRQIPFKVSIGDRLLWAPTVGLQVQQVAQVWGMAPMAELRAPADALLPGSRGFHLRSMPVLQPLPVFARIKGFWCYTPEQFKRYAIDLNQPFEEYAKKFSAKTRSNFVRAVKKFAERNAGGLDFRAYQSEAELAEFRRLAGALSAKTYQEKQLDAGLPRDEEFWTDLARRAGEGGVRAYVLFDAGEAVSYLLSAAQGDVLTLLYLGYDPAYAQFSVGTVLRWSSFPLIFAEQKFRYFDFSEGEAEYKRLFSTRSCDCANVYFFKPSLYVGALILCQQASFRFSTCVGDMLERFGLKAKIKKLMRFGR